MSVLFGHNNACAIPTSAPFVSVLITKFLFFGELNKLPPMNKCSIIYSKELKNNVQSLVKSGVLSPKKIPMWYTLTWKRTKSPTQPLMELRFGKQYIRKTVWLIELECKIFIKHVQRKLCFTNLSVDYILLLICMLFLTIMTWKTIKHLLTTKCIYIQLATMKNDLKTYTLYMQQSWEH